MRKNDKIDGIFNYCDGWCERCAFTQRCAVGIAESKLSDEQKDMTNEAFWLNISDNFANAIALLRKEADKRGFSLEMSAEEQAEYAEQQKKINKEVKDSVLMKTSHDYSIAVHKWQGKMRPFLENKRDEFIQFFEMGLHDEQEILAKADKIKESLDVILWYSFFISAKFNRALHGKLEDDGWERENGFQRDFDGSAKIALIGAERSLTAWAQLSESLPDMMDDMLPMMANLQKIIRMGDSEFDEARQFKRPGFDTLNTNATS
jgi:L-rhamnose mutarotase